MTHWGFGELTLFVAAGGEEFNAERLWGPIEDWLVNSLAPLAAAATSAAFLSSILPAISWLKHF